MSCGHRVLNMVTARAPASTLKQPDQLSSQINSIATIVLRVFMSLTINNSDIYRCKCYFPET